MIPIRHHIYSECWMDNFYANDEDCQKILNYGPLEDMDDETKQNMRRLINKAGATLTPRTLMAIELRFSIDDDDNDRYCERHCEITKRLNDAYGDIQTLSAHRVHVLIHKGIGQLLIALRQVATDEKLIAQSVPITVLDLPSRAYTALRFIHIETVDQLRSIPYYRISRLYGIGKVTMAMIIDALRKIDPDCPCVRDYDRLYVVDTKVPAIRCIFGDESPFTVIVSGKTDTECRSNIAKIESALGARDETKDIIGFVNDKGKFTVNGPVRRV